MKLVLWDREDRFLFEDGKVSNTLQGRVFNRSRGELYPRTPFDSIIVRGEWFDVPVSLVGEVSSAAASAI